MNKIIIPDGIEAETAEYKDQVVPDYMHNPLIEALPSLLTSHEVIRELAYYPEYNANERLMEKHYRIHMVNRLFKLFQPLSMCIELERKISSAIRQGYIARNPFAKNFIQGFYKDYSSINNRVTKGLNEIESSSFGFYLIGISGVGKTSSLNWILRSYPQIIVHSKYMGTLFSSCQVVFLILECPCDGSVKGLLLQFFAEIDRLLRTNYYERMVGSRATVDTMMTAMNQVARSCSLGMLIIDEIQHLSMSKSGGSDKMLNFFVNLINYVGVPVVLVGTPAAISLLQGDFRHARRGAGTEGDMLCDRLKPGKEWDLLVDAVWHYQWTSKPIELTVEIREALYNETQGIPDLLKKLYSIAQINAISSEKEEITASRIKRAAKENLKLVQPMIQALKTNNLREIAKYSDINLMYIDDLKVRTREEVYISSGKKVEKSINKKEIHNEKNNDKFTNKSMDASIKIHGHNDEEKPDIRRIVNNAIKQDKTAYTALKEARYILSYDEDIFTRSEE